MAEGMCSHQEVIFIERNPISLRVTETEPGRVWVCALKADQRHKINGGSVTSRARRQNVWTLNLSLSTDDHRGNKLF
jgi:hypothetical protein